MNSKLFMKNNESELFWSHAAAIHHSGKEPALVNQTTVQGDTTKEREETAVTILTSIELTGFLKPKAVTVLG